jgi:SAM-dependent methyltransferase
MVPRLTAVELDRDLAVSLAARLARPGVEVVQGDATDLSYASGRFSSVVCFTMLHHLPSATDQDCLFAEAARVLRPGGLFAGTDSLDSAEFRELHVDDICVPVEPSRLAARLERAGFTEVRVDLNDYGVRFRGWRA